MASSRNWRKAYEAGLEYSENHDFVKAIAAFGTAISEGADRWEPFYGRAWATWKLDDDADDEDGELAEAREQLESDLKRALELCGPSCGDAAALLGQYYEKLGRYGDAVGQFLTAVSLASHLEVEDALVNSMSRELDSLERDSETFEGVAERCKTLQEMVQAAHLPRPINNGLIGEILSTLGYCAKYHERETEATEAFRQLARLVPGHPRIPAELASSTSAAESADEHPKEPRFDEVGGRGVPGSFQDRLCQIFERQFGDADINARRNLIAAYGQVPTRSILLFGPSGCGKTYIIRAFTGEYRHRYGRPLPIYKMPLNKVLNKWVGETEKSMSRIFDDAIQNQPSLIFADEIDSIGGVRDDGQEWRAAQTGHLLQELDRLRACGAFVIFFACTNRIWSLDLALLRRFDELFSVTLPTPDVRSGIFKVQLQKLNEQVRPRSPNLHRLAVASHSLTPGDIERIVRQSVDRLMEGALDLDHLKRLDEQSLLEELDRAEKPPSHVRQFAIRSIAALRKAGEVEKAEEVKRAFQPYIFDLDELVEDGEHFEQINVWQPLPSEAWFE